MKSVSVSVSFLCLAPVLSFVPVPFKLREITQASAREGVEQRIYGGLVAEEGQFPYMIFVMMKLPDGKMSQCSASLLAPEWVLLAAHCVNFHGLRARNIILIGGRSRLSEYVEERLKIDYNRPIDKEKFDLQERRAVSYYVHPKYKDSTLHHDVALVRVNGPFVLGKVQTIPLATEEMRSPKMCTIQGWGLTSGNKQSYKLYYVHDREVSTTKLGCAHKRDGSFICLKPDTSGICQGDSGSPLVCDNKVWGVASHFVTDSKDPDCGDSIEEYYTELHPEIEWLKRVMDGSPGSAFRSTATSFECVLLCALAALLYGGTKA